MISRLFTLALCVIFLFYSVALPGCSSSLSTTHLDKYDDLPFRDTFTLNGSEPSVHRAAIRALQEDGYLISLSERESGLINAELTSSHVLAEEMKEVKPESSSGTSLFWTIIGIIFFVWLIALIVGSEDSEEDKQEERTRDREPDPSVGIDVDVSKTITYRYLVTVTTRPTGELTTEVQVLAVRQELEDGTLVESRRMENKYLNYRLVEMIEIGLAR